MSNIFSGATAFNQDIGNWDVSKATDIDFMFTGATSFKQDLSNWSTTNVTHCEDFNTDSGLRKEQLPKVGDCFKNN